MVLSACGRSQEKATEAGSSAEHGAKAAGLHGVEAASGSSTQRARDIQVVTIPRRLLNPPGAPPDPRAMQQAEQFFLRTCAVCHGAEGRGNGPGAGGLSIPPRDYSDGGWQAQVTDEDIKRTILGGGASVGKDPAMPPHPQLLNKLDVLNALVFKIRSIGGRTGELRGATPER